MNNTIIAKYIGTVKACEQCGNDDDFMIVFAKYPICAKCVRKNHKAATKNRLA